MTDIETNKYQDKIKELLHGEDFLQMPARKSGNSFVFLIDAKYAKAKNIQAGDQIYVVVGLPNNGWVDQKYAEAAEELGLSSYTTFYSKAIKQGTSLVAVIPSNITLYKRLVNQFNRPDNKKNYVFDIGFNLIKTEQTSDIVDPRGENRVKTVCPYCDNKNITQITELSIEDPSENEWESECANCGKMYGGSFEVASIKINYF